MSCESSTNEREYIVKNPADLYGEISSKFPLHDDERHNLGRSKNARIRRLTPK